MRHRALIAVLLLAAAASTRAADAPALSHDVYFSLKQPSAAGRAELVAACRKYLAGHEGVLFFSVGVRAEELARPVNDRDFDVALHITFASRAAHDAYQEHPRHKQFIAEQEKSWQRVRVFDSLVELAK